MKRLLLLLPAALLLAACGGQTAAAPATPPPPEPFEITNLQKLSDFERIETWRHKRTGACFVVYRGYRAGGMAESIDVRVCDPVR